MSLGTLSRRALVLGAAIASVAGQALAQAAAFPFRLYGQSNQLLRGGPIGVPSYQISFFTSTQGTAVASIGARSRLTTTLANVSEQVMRDLVDEAFADLKTRLQAASLPVLAQDTLNADIRAAGVELAPNNAEITKISAGVTIGQSIRKAYAAFGAKDAPLIRQLHQVTGVSGFGAMNAMGVNNKLSEVARKHQAVLLMPMLAIDFAQTSASTGRSLTGAARSNVSSRLSFTVSAPTKAALMTSMNNGRASSPGAMLLRSEISVPASFGTVLEGEGAVRALSINSSVNSFYIEQENSRGDAVEVDIPAWQALVRSAFQAFNTALVEEFRKARG